MPKSTNQKEIIVKTALKLFAERGYDRTPISLIAKTAKVSQGLLYNFFKGKDDLLKEMMAMGFQDISQSMTSYQTDPTPEQAIETHIKSTIKIIKQHKEFWTLLHAIRLQGKVPKVLHKQFQGTVQFVTASFQKVFKKLGIKNPELEAILFLTQIDGMVILYLQDEETPIDKLGQQLINRYIK
jgi:AcrR family transcriptional regulator